MDTSRVPVDPPRPRSGAGCGCLDTCPCVGPGWVCWHGYYGPTLGTPGEVIGTGGPPTPVNRVTADDCRRCPLGPSDGGGTVTVTVP
jgi:hypothetical protein